MACPHQALGRPCYLLKVWPPQAESNQMELNQETIVKSSKQVNMTIEERLVGRRRQRGWRAVEKSSKKKYLNDDV
jgi:hypothetical protein